MSTMRPASWARPMKQSARVEQCLDAVTRHDDRVGDPRLLKGVEGELDVVWVVLDQKNPVDAHSAPIGL